MRALERLSGEESSAVVFAVVANLVPLVGVVVLGWSAGVLVAIYWFELAVLCFWALLRALFAGRPSEFDPEPLLLGVLADRSASIPIPLTGLGIQLSSLPVLVAATPTLALVWFLVGALTVGLVGGAADDPAALSAIVVATAIAFLVEGGRTVFAYVLRGGYREHSAQTAVQGVFLRCSVLFAVGLGTTFVAIAAAPSTAGDDSIAAAESSIVGAVALVGIVLVKLAVDLAGVYRDRLIAFDDAHSLEWGWAYEPPVPERIDTTLSANERRIRPHVFGRLIATFSHACRYPSAWALGSLPCLLAVVFAIGGFWAAAVGLVAGGVSLALLLIHLDYWLRYGAVEYRTDGEAIVAYDRLFRSALWRVEAWDESGLALERDRLDRLLGTATVVIDLPDGERRLPRLREVEPVLTVFDRRPAEAEAALE